MANVDAATTVDDWRVVEGVDVRLALREAHQSAVQDVYGPLEQVRSEHGSVYRGDVLVEKFGVACSAAAMVERPVVSVLGIQEASTVLKDFETFSSTIMQESVGKSMGRNLLVVDPPEHSRLRSAVQGAFGKRQVESFGYPYIENAVDAALNSVEQEGRTNFFETVIQWLPANIIFGILGLPLEKKEQFRLYSTALTLMTSSVPHVAMSCSRWLADTLGQFMADRGSREAAGVTPGLIDTILDTQGELPQGLTSHEMLDFLRVLLPAGSDTTIAGLGTVFLALLTHPDQLDMVRNDPSVLPAAVDEALRWQAPSQFNYRLAVRDTTIGSVEVAAGTGVIVCQGAANRDPARWANPEEFDLTRKTQPNVAFGYGAHNCLGAHLARAEMRIAVAKTLQRFPRIRLDEDRPAPTSVGLHFRSADSLHARWD